MVWKNYLEGDLMTNLRLRTSDGGANLSPEKIAQVGGGEGSRIDTYIGTTSWLTSV